MALDVFYSFSPFGTGDLKTGSPTITISGGVATFSIAQTGNIGIGCRVTYDTSKVAFISSYNSGTSFNLVTAIGGTPSDEVSAVTVNSIAHEYASFSTLEAGFTDANHVNNTDLTAADVVVHACHYYDHDDFTPDSIRITVNFGTTDATRNFKYIVPTGGTQSVNNQQHPGKYDSNKALFELDNDADSFITLNQAYTEFIGAQVYNKFNNSNTSCLKFNDVVGLKVDKCVLRTLDDAAGNGIMTGFSFTSLTAEITNTVIYHGGAEGSSSEGIYIISCDTVNIINCTVYNFNDGIERDGGTVNARNCAVFGCSNDFDGTITITNCATEEGAGEGTNGVAITQTASNYAALVTDQPNGDFSLKDDGSELYNTGTNTGAPSDDIIGTSRPQATTCDIGAFEFEVSTQLPIKLTPTSETISFADTYEAAIIADLSPLYITVQETNLITTIYQDGMFQHGAGDSDFTRETTDYDSAVISEEDDLIWYPLTADAETNRADRIAQYQADDVLTLTDGTPEIGDDAIGTKGFAGDGKWHFSYPG